MNEIIIYFLKVITIQGLLFLFYHLFLRNSTRHALNRGFLMASLLLAFVIPTIEFTLPEKEAVRVDETPLIFWLSEPSSAFDQLEMVAIKEDVSFTWWSVVPWFLGLVSIVLIIRSLIYLVILQKLKKHSESIRKRWFTLFKTSHDRPFSFFRNVFIPRELFGSDEFRQVLAHECVHVRQLHSVDRLLLDFVVSLFWFNPFIYLYRNALIEIHEYQADEAVVKRFKDPIGYQEILFSQLQSPQYSGLVSHFNVEMIKKRIVMMNKPEKRTGWVYALTLPVLLMIVFAFSSKEAMKPLNEVGEEISGLMGPIGDVKGMGLDFFQNDHEPSILPLNGERLKRMSSGFGMRMHPIQKVRKMHLGADFSCPTGSEILATADGVVEKVEIREDGYGKLLTISHGGEYKTRYAQLSEFKVEEGDEVTKGQVVALSGNSGASAAPHLHYEVFRNGERVDPLKYIKNYKFMPKGVPIRSESHTHSSTSKGVDKKENEERSALEKQITMESGGEKEKAETKQKSKTKDKEKTKDKKSAYRVIIDPGHGGEDHGATSPSGVFEKEISLAIARMIKQDFTDEDQIEIILTREEDTFLSLTERPQKASGADLFISLHTDNYAGEGSFIVPVYYDMNEHSGKSERFAHLLAYEFEKNGKEARVGYSSGYYVLKNAGCPAVLLNVGWFSDPDQDEYLSSESGQKQVASQISDAIKLAVL